MMGTVVGLTLLALIAMALAVTADDVFFGGNDD